MSQQLERYISELRNLPKFDGEYVEQFEQVLEKIDSLDDPSSIILLSQFFDDEAEYDELMFSLIHSIEKFDDVTYINALLEALPNLSQKAPDWCSVLLKRVNNNSNSKEVLAVALESSDNHTRQLVDSILTKN